jgi:hypothetical protein
MANKPTRIELEEVRKFEEAKRQLQQFMQQHKAVFDEYRQYVEYYNAALEQADRALRSACEQDGNLYRCGEFSANRKKVSYKLDVILGEIGVDRFKEIGGEERTVTEYHIDDTTLEQAEMNHMIPFDVARRAKKVTFYISKPKKLTM